MEQMQNGKILLSHICMNGYREYALYNGIFDHMQVIGWPSETGSGVGAVVDHNMLMAITSESSKKEEAFHFLKTFWTYQYQKENISVKGFPTRKDVLEKKLEYAAAKQPYTDEDGDMVTVSGGTDNINGVTITYDAMSEEQGKIIRKLIDSVDRIDFSVSRKEDLISIIAEEVESYFSGDRTREDVIKVIESRVKLYVNEKS